jgi:hypothetical protein
MPDHSVADDSLEHLLASLCKEALTDESVENPSVIFYTRAPKGKTIAEAARTISLNRRAYNLLQNLIVSLRADKRLRIGLSRKELENEAITSLFDGTEAMQSGTFDSAEQIQSLLARLHNGRETWNIYLPINGLDLPTGISLYLAGGILKSLTNEEQDFIKDQSLGIWRQSRWAKTEQAEQGIRYLADQLESTLGNSKMWYHIVMCGRADAAKARAVESASLAMDILAFFALANSIDPECFASCLGHQAQRGTMRSFSIAEGRSCVLNFDSGFPFPYSLKLAQYERLLGMQEFKEIQRISNCDNPNPVEQRFLLGVQQFAEATRATSLGARLVWYLSALETIFLSERERQSKRLVKSRIGKVLHVAAAEMLDGLYEERKRIIHYGYRNQIPDEYTTEAGVHQAKSLSYLGILRALSLSLAFSEVEPFLNHLETLHDIE